MTFFRLRSNILSRKCCFLSQNLRIFRVEATIFVDSGLIWQILWINNHEYILILRVLCRFLLDFNGCEGGNWLSLHIYKARNHNVNHHTLKRLTYLTVQLSANLIENLVCDCAFIFTFYDQHNPSTKQGSRKNESNTLI